MEFFNAPYTVYPGESGFDLAFYSSPKAIKVYTIAQKKKLLLPPDDVYHLNNIAKGLKYIQRFCSDKDIAVMDYINHREGIQSGYIVHLKERKISVYNLFAFADFERNFSQHDPDLLRFTLGDVYDNIAVFRTKFLTSKSAKLLAKQGLEKIKNNNKAS